MTGPAVDAIAACRAVAATMAAPTVPAMPIHTDTTPQFDHDCDRCLFLGRQDAVDGYPAADAYICRNMFGAYDLVRRHGNDGPEYGSMPADHFAPAADHVYGEMVIAIIEAGLVELDAHLEAHRRAAQPTLDELVAGLDPVDESDVDRIFGTL